MANSLMEMMGGAPATKPTAAPISNTEAFRQAIESAKRMMGMLNAVKDPQKALMTVAQQNPELNATLQILNGRSFQDACIEEYKKRGIDYNGIINELRR